LSQKTSHLAAASILPGDFVQPLTQDPFSASIITERYEGFSMVTREFKALISASDSAFSEPKQGIELRRSRRSLPTSQMMASCQQARSELCSQVAGCSS
jgi:hypothetical protein